MALFSSLDTAVPASDDVVTFITQTKDFELRIDHQQTDGGKKAARLVESKSKEDILNALEAEQTVLFIIVTKKVKRARSTDPKPLGGDAIEKGPLAVAHVLPSTTAAYLQVRFIGSLLEDDGPRRAPPLPDTIPGIDTIVELPWDDAVRLLLALPRSSAASRCAALYIKHTDGTPALPLSHGSTHKDLDGYDVVHLDARRGVNAAERARAQAPLRRAAHPDRVGRYCKASDPNPLDPTLILARLHEVFAEVLDNAALPALVGVGDFAALSDRPFATDTAKFERALRLNFDPLNPHLLSFF